MVFYYKTIDEIMNLQKEKDVDFVRLSMRSVCESMANHSREWMKCLGQQLNDYAKKRLYEIKVKLDVRFSFFQLSQKMFNKNTTI